MQDNEDDTRGPQRWTTLRVPKCKRHSKRSNSNPLIYSRYCLDGSGGQQINGAETGKGFDQTQDTEPLCSGKTPSAKGPQTRYH